MKKSLLIVLFLAVGTWAYAQDGNVFLGFRFAQDMGVELGVLKDGIGYKAIASCDYELWSYADDVKKGEYSKHLGERYHLMYGAGFLMRVADPVWVSLNAGYGWAGKYGWDRDREIAGSISTVKGLDVGIEVRCNIDVYYLSLGYETIPAGFRINKPVNIVTLAAGFTF